MSERDRPQYRHEEEDPPPYDEGGLLPTGFVDVATIAPGASVPGAHVEPWSAPVGSVRRGDHVVLTGTATGDLVVTSNLPTHRAAAVLVRAAAVLRGDVLP